MAHIVLSQPIHPTPMDKQIDVREEQYLSDAGYIICGVYLTILGALAVCGNILVLLVLALGRPNFMKIHSMMLFNISTSDLMVACTAYPLTAVSCFRKVWIFSDTTCVLTGFIVYFFVMGNINSMCVMAGCRYVIVCRPDLEHYLRGRYIKYYMVFVWVYALMWTGTPLIGWSSYQQESFGTSCTLNWDGRTVSDISYNSMCIVFCYLVPVALFLFCYYNVAKSSLFQSRATSNGTIRPGRDRSSSEIAMEEMCRRFKVRASRHMTLVCFVMVVSFITIWTPYAVLTFFNLVSAPATPGVQVLPTMFCKLSCVVNPLIYCGLCGRFREAMSRLFLLSNRVLPSSIVRRSVQRPTQNEILDVTVHGLVDISNRVYQPQTDSDETIPNDVPI